MAPPRCCPARRALSVQPWCRVPVVLVLLVLMAPIWAGCFGEPEILEPVERAGWQVGDRWTYLRSDGDAPGVVYQRRVSGLFADGEHTVLELTEGIQGHPVVQRNRYTHGALRFVGQEVTDAGRLVQSIQADDPVVYHYLFPLGEGRSIHQRTTLHQTLGGHAQDDPIEVTAKSGPAERITLGERIYEVFPYRIEIRFQSTPFDEGAVITGHWAPAVGQSVLTRIEEAGTVRTYELLSFDRARPVGGPPAYDLVPGLESKLLQRGFRTSLEGAGYQRHLFHVEAPTEIGVRFGFPDADGLRGAGRIDYATIRPLGYARAGIADDLQQIATDGVVLHVAATDEENGPITFHAPQGPALDHVRLEPGQVYEMLVASNRGGVSAELRLGNEQQARVPAETGAVDVVALRHRDVNRSTAPGPQNVRDEITAFVSLPEGDKVEGLVFAIDRGPGPALGEVSPVRQVAFRVDGVPIRSEDQLYAFYTGYTTRYDFEVTAAHEYTADMAVRGGVDYALGALLLRLVPPDR